MCVCVDGVSAAVRAMCVPRACVSVTVCVCRSVSVLGGRGRGEQYLYAVYVTKYVYEWRD